MKEIVVVIGGDSVFFKGKALAVINRYVDTGSIHVGSELLIVKDGKEDIAVFQEWQYWRKLK